MTNESKGKFEEFNEEPPCCCEKNRLQIPSEIGQFDVW